MKIVGHIQRVIIVVFLVAASGSVVAEERMYGSFVYNSEIATHWGIEFFDAGDVISTSPVDGVHFEKEAHRALGVALSKKITTII